MAAIQRCLHPANTGDHTWKSTSPRRVLQIELARRRCQRRGFAPPERPEKGVPRSRASSRRSSCRPVFPSHGKASGIHGSCLLRRGKQMATSDVENGSRESANVKLLVWSSDPGPGGRFPCIRVVSPNTRYQPLQIGLQRAPFPGRRFRPLPGQRQLGAGTAGCSRCAGAEVHRGGHDSGRDIPASALRTSRVPPKSTVTALDRARRPIRASSRLPLHHALRAPLEASGWSGEAQYNGLHDPGRLGERRHQSAACTRQHRRPAVDGHHL